MRKVHPHYDINVRDDSLEILEEVENLPTFRPVYAMKCEKGIVGVPMWNPDMATAIRNFGAETFNKNNPEYFSRASAFLMQSLPYCGAYIIRLGSQTAGVTKLANANRLLYASVDLSANTWSWESRPLGGDTVADLLNAQFSPSTTPVVGGVTGFTGVPTELTGHVSSAGAYPGDIDISDEVSSEDPSRINISIEHATDLESLLALEFPIHNLGTVGALSNATVTATHTDGVGGPTETTVMDISFVLDTTSGDVVKVNLEEATPGVTTKLDIVLDFQFMVNPAASAQYMGSTYLGWKFYETNFTVNTSSAPVYTIPFMAFEVTNPGKYGNQYGVNLSADMDSVNLADLSELKNVLYSLGFVYQKTNQTTVSKVLTKYSNQLFNFALDGEMVDPAINSTVGLDVVVDRYWGDEYPAPVASTVFDNNVKFMLNILKQLAVEASDDDVTTVMEERPFSVNLFDLKTKWFDSAEEAELDVGNRLGLTVTDDTASDGANGLGSSVNIALSGGSDGYLDIGGAALDNNGTIEADIQAVWGTTAVAPINPEIQDNARYPFNMIVDTGYDLLTKNSMISMLARRDDVKPVLTAWSGSDLDEANSIAAAQGLVTTIRTYPESIIFGTNTFQAVVFGQVGAPANVALYRKQVPTTFWYVDKLARMHNLSYIADNPEGKTARVESMKDLSWTPFSDSAKKNLWAACVNYAQYFSRTGLHFPSLKSVYEHESSLFTNDSFVNMVLYVKQLLPSVWADHAGRTDSNNIVYGEVLEELDGKLAHLLAGKANFKTRMYQTAAERKAGFEHHISVELFDDLGQRIWHYDIIGKRATPAA